MKNKIKKILIGLICAVSITSSLTSCDTEDLISTKYCDFVKIYEDLLGEGGMGYAIYADKNTGVCYLQWGRGVTVLVDAEGKPIIWEEFSENYE